MNSPQVISISLATAALLNLASCTAPDNPPDDPEPTAAAVVDELESYPRYSEAGHLTDWALMRLCRGINVTDIERSDARSGPHARSEIWIRLNDLASDALATAEGEVTAFPVGSIILKEKSPWDGGNFAGSGLPPREPGVGGMIKRAPGYDPEFGDWEYLFSAGGELEQGKIASCRDCHANASSTDHVFGDWRTLPEG